MLESTRKRLEAEYYELLDRLQKLDRFIGTESFDLLDSTDKELLQEQRRAMNTYFSILSERVSRVRGDVTK